MMQIVFQDMYLKTVKLYILAITNENIFYIIFLKINT